MSNQLLGLLSQQELMVLEDYLLKNNKCNESDLIKTIFKLTTRPKPDFYNPLDLFHGHFILFNALHRLNHTNTKKYYIYIKLTRIQLTLKHQQSLSSLNLIEKNNSKLISYYMDENNFRATSETKIQEMLESFYVKLETYLKQRCIKKTTAISWKELDSQYQKLIQQEPLGQLTNNLELNVISAQHNQLKKYQSK